MFLPEGQVRVFLYGQPVNMRQSFDGLYALAKQVMQQDPLSGHLFAFINRRAMQIKDLIDGNDDAALFFDETKVPVEVIAVPDDEAAELDPADFEVIGEKVSFRLAQRPGSYVILNYIRPVIKLHAEQTLSCPPVRVSVLDGCRADVSFIAGVIIDKFAYHQPLYRQHVKLQDSGFNVSRAWLTKLMPASVSLLKPIFNAQLESVRRSRVIAMDETPIKAGRAGPGKMKAAHFQPVVGE